MTAIVPSGCTTGKVVVTTPGGTLTSNVNFRIPAIETPGGPALEGRGWLNLSAPSHSPDAFFSSFISSFINFRSARLIRVWYPRPLFLNQAITSASRRSVTGFLIGRYHSILSGSVI